MNQVEKAHQVIRLMNAEITRLEHKVIETERRLEMAQKERDTILEKLAEVLAKQQWGNHG